MRRALRLSKSGFAARLGITPRSVKNWEDGGGIAAFSEDLLDSLLARASEDAQQRFFGDLRESANLDNLLDAGTHAAYMPVQADGNRSPWLDETAAVTPMVGDEPSSGGARKDDWRGAMAGALTRRGSVFDGEPPPEDALLAAVAVAKSHYQSCSYRDVTAQLPDLIVQLITALAVADGGSRLWTAAAEAYQVAASVLLKFDDCGLAVLAADRSMSAARASGDPVTIASSTRSVTHALMGGGHYGEAVTMSVHGAEELDRVGAGGSAEAISVYGALLLRGALAAARAEQRSTALGMLDEAQEAAVRLGYEGNERWTSFGPTNVLLHRVSASVSLGDAGQALEYAGRVDMVRVATVERRASLMIDTAQAYRLWGKHEQACQALAVAAATAPEEARARTAVWRLVADLRSCPAPSVQRHAAQLAAQLGIAQ